MAHAGADGAVAAIALRVQQHALRDALHCAISWCATPENWKNRRGTRGLGADQSVISALGTPKQPRPLHRAAKPRNLGYLRRVVQTLMVLIRKWKPEDIGVGNSKRKSIQSPVRPIKEVFFYHTY